MSCEIIEIMSRVSAADQGIFSAIDFPFVATSRQQQQQHVVEGSTPEELEEVGGRSLDFPF